jgi:hypothetical protein
MFPNLSGNFISRVSTYDSAGRSVFLELMLLAVLTPAQSRFMEQVSAENGQVAERVYIDPASLPAWYCAKGLA